MALITRRCRLLPILDVVIGVIFVYLVLALLVTAANEWVAGLFGMRAKMLRRAITRLVEAPLMPAIGEKHVETPKQPEPPGERTRRFYEHPKIAALADGKTPPSYIPPETFAEVVRSLGWVEQPAGKPRRNAAPVEAAAAVSPSGTAPVDPYVKLFNDTMQRATGWYKRQTQVMTIAIGAAVVIFGNADTLQIANSLWASPTLRAAVVQQASLATQKGSPIEQRVRDARYPTSDPMPAEGETSSEEEGGAPNASTDGPPLCGSGDDFGCQTLQKIIGWGPDYKVLNGEYCHQLEQRRDRVCGSIDANPECQKELEHIANEPRCNSSAGSLTPTAGFPGDAFFSAAVFSLAAGHVLGWLFTLAAISLGAPFWFDMLKGLMNIRNAGPSPDDKKKGDSGSATTQRVPA